MFMSSYSTMQAANSCTIVKDLMVKEEDVEIASYFLKAIAHPLRLKILCILSDNEVSVNDIVENVGTSQSKSCLLSCGRCKIIKINTNDAGNFL